MCRMVRSLLVLALWHALVPAAQAQLVGLKHLWTVPAVLNTGAGLKTVVGCTNGNATNQTVGVNIYGPANSYEGGLDNSCSRSHRFVRNRPCWKFKH